MATENERRRDTQLDRVRLSYRRVRAAGA